MDKAFLTNIIQQKFAVPEGCTPAGLLPDLLAGLGSTDPVLRDELCLEILCTWVYEGRYTPEELRRLAAQLLENLKAGLGQGETDQVFLRTFSVLVLRWVVEYDQKAPFLTPGEFGAILEGGLSYLEAEQDLRGYVPVQGWAHAAAHTADLLGALARHPLADGTDLERLLEAILTKVQAPTVYPFIENEDGRLGRAAIGILRRDLVPLDRISTVIGRMGEPSPKQKTYMPGRDSAPYHNTRSFLQALYVRLAHPDFPAALRTELQPVIYSALKSYTPGTL